MKKIERIQIICRLSAMSVEDVRTMIPNRAIRTARVVMKRYPFECYELTSLEARDMGYSRMELVVIFCDPSTAFNVSGLLSLAKFEVGETYHLEFKHRNINGFTRDDLYLVSSKLKLALNVKDDVAVIAGMKIDTGDTLQSLVWRNEVDLSTAKFKVKEFTQFKKPVFTLVQQ